MPSVQTEGETFFFLNAMSKTVWNEHLYETWACWIVIDMDCHAY